MGTLSLTNFDDVRIAVPWGHIAGRWYGNRTERPILAIHGWLDNLRTFDTLIPLLPDYLGVLCIDLPGHGLSSHVAAGLHYNADDWVLAIHRVVKAYKWPKVSLMGHSMGGVLNFIYTTLTPQTVDLVISLDILLSPFETPDSLFTMAYFMEKHLVEEMRAAQVATNEPPSYTMPQLSNALSNASSNSVTPEYAQHLLERNVTRSQLYPDKFYFSRDGRIKYYTLFPLDEHIACQMARQIKQKPFLIIKAVESSFVYTESKPVISILAEDNPHFEYHEVPGSHHVHLTDPKVVAKYVVPFLRRHRPPPITSWSNSFSQPTTENKQEQRSKL